MKRYLEAALDRVAHPLHRQGVVSVATAMFADGDYEQACAFIAQAVNAATKGEGDRDCLVYLLGAERVITTLSFSSLRRRRRRTAAQVRVRPQPHPRA